MVAAMLALALAVAIPAIAQSIGQGLEPTSGNVALKDVAENSGNYASQCTPDSQFGNSGNFDNSPAILQYGGRSGGIEPGGVAVTDEPTVTVSCDRSVMQSSAASG